MNIGDLQPGLSLIGLEPELICKVVAINRIADNSVQVIYRTPDGVIRERLVGQSECDTIFLATTKRRWALGGDAVSFQSFYTVAESRILIERWREHYTVSARTAPSGTARRHALGDQPPAASDAST